MLAFALYTLSIDAFPISELLKYLERWCTTNLIVTNYKAVARKDSYWLNSSDIILFFINQLKIWAIFITLCVLHHWMQVLSPKHLRRHFRNESHCKEDHSHICAFDFSTWPSVRFLSKNMTKSSYYLKWDEYILKKCRTSLILLCPPATTAQKSQE